MTPSIYPAAIGPETVAYKQPATGDLLIIECASLTALQLRNLSTQVKTLTILGMVEKHVQAGRLLPVAHGEYLQHLQDLHTGRRVQVL